MMGVPMLLLPASSVAPALRAAVAMAAAAAVAATSALSPELVVAPREDHRHPQPTSPYFLGGEPDRRWQVMM